jgi:capsular polysaccharide biosynthesis protein
MMNDRRISTSSEAAEREDALPLTSLAHILWRRLWVIVLVTTLLTGVVVGYNLIQEPQYQASVTILIGQKRALAKSPNDAVALQSVTQTMAQAVDTLPIARAASKQLDQQVTTGGILGGLSAEQVPETQFIQVNYTHPNPKTAQSVVNAVGAAFSERVAELNSGTSGITATVWDSATVPSAPISPSPMRNGFLAFLLGVMLGAGLAFVLEYFDSRWQSPEEAERISGVPTFGVIPEYQVSTDGKQQNVSKG